MKAALIWQESPKLSAEESKELKSLYRTLIKALHPDLNPGLDEAQLSLFHLAVASYEAGDLQQLRMIDLVINKENIAISDTSNLDKLTQEEESLTLMIEKLQAEMAQIKSSFPHTMKDLLEDPEAIKKQRGELEAPLAQLKESDKIYKEKIQELLR